MPLRPRPLRSLLALCALLLAVSSVPQAGAQPLRVLTTEEAPTNYTRDGLLTGITVDIVRTLLERQGLKTPIEIYPWPRTFAIAQSAPNVVIFTAARTPEREALGFSFVGPVTTRRHALFARADDVRRYPSLDALRKERPLIAGMRGDWRAAWVGEQKLPLYATNSHAQSLRMLLAGRVDLAVLSDLEVGADLDAIGSARQSVRLAYVIEERAAYILLSKGTPADTRARWQSEFTRLQEGDFFRQLSSRWSAILGLPLHYSPVQGIHIEPATERGK